MPAIFDEHRQWLDTSGKPLVSGQVYFGVQSADPTVSPQTIYSDRELTTAIANPQTLDAYGRLTNKVWIRNSYSIRVNNVSGSQVYQELDNGEPEPTGITQLGSVAGANVITASASPAITAYVDKHIYVLQAVSANSDEVTLNFDGVGAKALTKNNDVALSANDIEAGQFVEVVYSASDDGFQMLSPSAGVSSSFNVREFGTVGDGVADDTVALQAAIDAAISRGGSPLDWSEGTYLVTAPLTHSGPVPIIFRGVGNRKTIIKASGNFDALLRLEGGAYGVPIVGLGAVTSITVTHGGKYTSVPSVTITGDGTSATGTAVLTAGVVTSVTIDAGGSGYTTAEVEFGASESANLSLGLECYGIGFDTTGTTTSCVHVARGAWQWHFDTCRFTGDGNTSLFKTYGTFGNLRNFIFDCDGASTLGLDVLGKMINSHIDHGRFGSIGSGYRFRAQFGPTGLNGATDDRPQGITCTDVHSLCTGAYNLTVSEALFLKFVGCWFTESSGNQAIINARASEIDFAGCHFGGGDDTIVQCLIQKDSGNNISFNGGTINHGLSAIKVVADADEQLDGLQIRGVFFNNVLTSTLDLDSVVNAIITGNIDQSTPTNGSWTTAGSHSSNKGDYTFDNNVWHTQAPTVFQTAAAYRWGNDTGIVMRARGAEALASGTTGSITHGLSRTPGYANLSPSDSVGDWHVNVLGASTFSLAWATTVAPTWYWEAQV